jgi:hypothetical protein
VLYTPRIDKDNFVFIILFFTIIQKPTQLSGFIFGGP